MHTAKPIKARSRIAKKPVVASTPELRVRKPFVTPNISDWLLARQRQLVTLGISTIGLALLLLKVSPSKVANILLPESYLIVLVLVGMFVFSLSRLFLRRLFAGYLTYLAVILLFIQLHQIVIGYLQLFLLALPIVIAHLVMLLVKKR